MVKGYPIQLTKEEINRILDEARINDFDYMLFLTLKNTGRRIGELYGVEEKEKKGIQVVGKKEVYIDGKPVIVDKVIPVYKRKGVWKYGVKVKDINFETGTMKVWVLKRRQFIQDETILTPELLSVMKVYVRKHKLELENYLFRKKTRSVRQMQNTIKSYAKKAGLVTEEEKDGVQYSLSLHSFRHYFVTELKRQGWNNEMIAKLTGHKSIGTLSTYDHILSTDIKDKALEALKEL